jgi:hypothetical protein
MLLCAIEPFVLNQLIKLGPIPSIFVEHQLYHGLAGVRYPIELIVKWYFETLTNNA